MFETEKTITSCDQTKQLVLRHRHLTQTKNVLDNNLKSSVCGATVPSSSELDIEEDFDVGDPTDEINFLDEDGINYSSSKNLSDLLIIFD